MSQLFNLIVGIPIALAQTATAEKSAGATFDILGYVFQNLPLWITAIVVFVLSMILGSILKGIVESRLAAKITEEHQELLIISGRLTFVGMVIIGGTISLAIAGINVTNLIAAIGFGISFGLQDTIANFVAGIALLASHPFTIGDWISVDGKKGKVSEIRTRATYLTTYDGLRLIVPNSQLYKGQVLSYTSNPMRRIKVPAYFRYYADIKKVYAICLNVVKSHPDILLEPKPNIVITEMGDYYIALQVRFWVDSKGLWRRIESRVFMEIQNKFEEAGIDAPYPTNALAFDTDDEQTVVRTKALTPEEMSSIMKMRADDEEKFAKRREELATVPHATLEDEQRRLDLAGSNFLMGTAMQAAAATQRNTPVQPLNAPQPPQAAEQFAPHAAQFAQNAPQSVQPTAQQTPPPAGNPTITSDPNTPAGPSNLQ